MRFTASRFTIVPLAALLVLSFAYPATARDDGTATLEATGDGLQTATFDTFSGTVTVNLPEDVVAGDTFSGTVVAEPEGDSEKKKDRNRSALVGYVFELADHPRGKVGDGRLKLDVPERRADGSVPTTATLILREVRKGKPGREVGRVDIPVLESAPPVPDFRLPTLSQQNVPLRVPGPFDGDLDSSALRVGGIDAIPLAESPRGAVFRSPHQVSGVVPISLEENGEPVAEGEVRNIGTNLSAPKSNLAAGESTTLTTRVVGLEGLDEEIPLRLRFWPPAIIQVQGGYDHSKKIRPEDVGPDGTYSFGVRITGRAPGGWGASVRVKVPEPQERVVDHYVLELAGRPVGRIEPVSGIGKKHLDSIAQEPISFQAGFDLAQPFYEWVQASLDNGPQRRDGRVVGVDTEGRAVEANQFKQAAFEAISFPALDVSDKSPVFMTFELDAESVQYEKSSAKKKLDVDGIVGPKTWQASNFRFELGDLPADRVSKIDSFKWEQKIEEDEVGSFREPVKEPAAIEVPNMKLHVSMADMSAWDRWHRSFYIVDRSRAGTDRPDARIVFLGPDGSDELGSLEFHAVTSSSLELHDNDLASEDPENISLQLAGGRLALHKD